jgi:hypothetical protein
VTVALPPHRGEAEEGKEIIEREREIERDRGRVRGERSSMRAALYLILVCEAFIGIKVTVFSILPIDSL